ncbi:MAG: hypothetical protein KME46_14010 [Brasilonema angustatum HA4187-MV1]|nr:hypothetical protein [Brasilonema angustatum HA4187-MV1]
MVIYSTEYSSKEAIANVEFSNCCVLLSFPFLKKVSQEERSLFYRNARI